MLDERQEVEGLEWLGVLLTDGAPGSNLDAVGEPLQPAVRTAPVPEEPPAEGDDPGASQIPGSDPTDPPEPDSANPVLGGNVSGSEASSADASNSVDDADEAGEGSGGDSSDVVAPVPDKSYNPQWTPVAQAVTDEDGAYLFSGLPQASEDGRPYIYRVRVVRPQDAHYVAALQGDDRNRDSDIVPVDNVPDAAEALTAEYSVGEMLPEGVNAYGQLMAQTSAQSWVRQTGRAVDMGFAFDPSAANVPKLHKMFPKLGDGALAFAAIALMLLALAALKLSARRRRGVDETPGK